MKTQRRIGGNRKVDTSGPVARDEPEVVRLLRQEVLNKSKTNVEVFSEYCFRDETGMPWKLGDHHRRYHRFMSENDRGVIFAPAEHGKCECKSAKVLMDSGLWVPIEDVKVNDWVRVYDPATGDWKSSRVTNTFNNGVRKVRRIQLNSGRQLGVTENHPLFTVDGWKTAGELRVKDAVASVRKFVPDNRITKGISANEAALLGLLIADGHLVQIGHIDYTKADPTMRARFQQLCSDCFGWGTSFGPRYRINVLQGKSETKIRDWTAKHGIGGVKSIHKVVPKAVQEGDNEAVAAFVGHHFAGDGHINPARHGSLELSSSSRELLEGTQLLLLRFGVVSRIRDHRVKCNGKPFMSWRLMITGQDNIRKFRSQIDVPGPKGAALWKLDLEDEGSSHNVADMVPEGWRKFLQMSQWDLRKAGLRVDIDPNHPRKGHHRNIVRRAAELDGGNATLQFLASEDLFWDFIEKIEEDEAETFAIEIDHPAHCYLSSGVISHNSRSLVARMLWEIGNDPNLTCCWLSNTQEQARKNTRAMREIIEGVQEVREAFPTLVPGEPWSDTGWSVGSRMKGLADCSMTALGMHGAITGSRLSRIVVDDPCDYENTRTPTMREDAYRWFTSSVISRLMPGAKCYLLMTSWHPEDLGHRLIKDGWPFIKDQIISPEGVPLWPERWPVARIEARRREMPSWEFARTYMNEVWDDATSRFKREWLINAMKKGSTSVLPELGSGCWTYALDRIPNDCRVVVGVDLAVSQRPDAHMTAFSVVLVKPNRERVLLCIESGRWTAPEILGRIALINDRYKGPIFRVENVLAQQFIVSMGNAFTTATIVPHYTGAGKASLPFHAEKLAAEMEQGLWTIPGTPNGDALNAEVQRLVEETLGYSPDVHCGDRLASLIFAREQADQGWGAIKTFTHGLFSR